jgi:hypothetical protein
VIRVDAVWLAVEPLDMRAGTEDGTGAREWDQAFPANRQLASATLDRLRHNAYCLVLDGQSYRAPKLPPAMSKAKIANTSKTTHS